MCSWFTCVSILVISIAGVPPQAPRSNHPAVEVPWNLKRKGKYTLCDFASTSTRRGSREGQIHDLISNSSTYTFTQQCRLRLRLSRKYAHGETPQTTKQQRSGHRCPTTKWQDVSADMRRCLQAQCWPARGAWKHFAAAYVINYYVKLLSSRCTGLSIRCSTRPCGRTSSQQKGGAGHELIEYFGK